MAKRGSTSTESEKAEKCTRVSVKSNFVDFWVRLDPRAGRRERKGRGRDRQQGQEAQREGGVRK
jgi:hypothetical protein